jgi:hypothetical protein
MNLLLTLVSQNLNLNQMFQCYWNDSVVGFAFFVSQKSIYRHVEIVSALLTKSYPYILLSHSKV